MPPDLAMRRKLPTTFWINIGILFLSLVLFLLTLGYPGMSGTFPRLVLIMIGGVTIIDLIKIVRKKDPEGTVAELQDQDRAVRLRKQGKVLYLAVLMFVFFFFMYILGVILGTFVFVFLSGWTLGYKKILSLLIASVIIAASVYLIFVVIMECFLPQGYLIELIGG